MSSIEETAERPDARERSLPRGPLERLAARLVLAELRSLSRGELVVSLPDGTTARFGTPGAEPPPRLRIARWRTFPRLLFGGDAGAARAYADGDWSADDLVGVVSLFLANAERFDRPTLFSGLSNAAWRVVQATRRNNRAGSRRNVAAHYDLGNAFYSLFLDPSMTYSCALFESGSDSLEDAQRRKLERIARLARLRKEDRVLEIGCGWGSFAIHAAKTVGCRVTGITLSKEQAAWARERVAREGLSDLIEIRIADYRALDPKAESFDRIVSVEMIEAVGHEFLPAFFACIDRLLAEDGLVVVQAITIPDQRYARYRKRPDFIQQEIFPGAQLPSITAMIEALTRATSLHLHRLEEIGPHYAETLLRWRRAFLGRRTEVLALGFPERFARMWEYYLAYCEGAYRARFVNDVQMVLTRAGNRSGA